MDIPFTKLSMCGNSYIYVDNRSHAYDKVDLADLARRVSDPNIGIGSDGLVLLESSERWAARMRIFNGDGSEGRMCGNGLRGLGRFIYEQDRKKYSGRDHIREVLGIEVGSSMRTINTLLDEDGWRSTTADLGVPNFKPGYIPIRHSWPGNIRFPIKTDRGTFEASCVSLGNPHCVVYNESGWRMQDVLELGPLISSAWIFLDKVNVEFVTVRSKREAVAQVWERGSGYTLSCGTGTGAIVASGVVLGLLFPDVTVHWPGGDLRAEWRPNHRIYLDGQAKKACEGTFIYSPCP